jgi:hypothetical protein
MVMKHQSILVILNAIKKRVNVHTVGAIVVVGIACYAGLLYARNVGQVQTQQQPVQQRQAPGAPGAPQQQPLKGPLNPTLWEKAKGKLERKKNNNTLTHDDIRKIRKFALTAEQAEWVKKLEKGIKLSSWEQVQRDLEGSKFLLNVTQKIAAARTMPGITRDQQDWLNMFENNVRLNQTLEQLRAQLAQISSGMAGQAPQDMTNSTWSYTSVINYIKPYLPSSSILGGATALAALAGSGYLVSIGLAAKLAGATFFFDRTVTVAGWWDDAGRIEDVKTFLIDFMDDQGLYPTQQCKFDALTWAAEFGVNIVRNKKTKVGSGALAQLRRDVQNNMVTLETQTPEAWQIEQNIDKCLLALRQEGSGEMNINEVLKHDGFIEQYINFLKTADVIIPKYKSSFDPIIVARAIVSDYLRFNMIYTVKKGGTVRSRKYVDEQLRLQKPDSLSGIKNWFSSWFSSQPADNTPVQQEQQQTQEPQGSF